MKKLISLLLCLTLCLGLVALAGCKAKEIKNEGAPVTGEESRSTDGSQTGESAPESEETGAPEGEGDPLDAMTNSQTGDVTEVGGVEAPSSSQTDTEKDPEEISKPSAPDIEVDDPDTTEKGEWDFEINMDDLLENP